MDETAHRAIAIVGAGAVLPDAPNVAAFWENVKKGRYSVTDVSPERWDPALYYDPDPKVSDKTYSKIGGWVREYAWDPVKWRLAIPPRVADAMDGGQKWAVACTREALEDYGYPRRTLDLDRTAVILGNAMAGEKHYLTALRIYFPEYARELSESSSFSSLPATLRNDITRELHHRIAKILPEITEDTMPGELANCIAGRVANVFNFHGPNYTADAACASAMAAISAAIEGLVQNHYDAVVTGGIDRNMGASAFVKFCKIGALSATGTRPYAEGADGFVMGEGTAIFILKRLADAERDGDRIYAVVRGVGGSSDGKGKGITAPNPVGQKFAIERAWKNAALSPASATYIEGHGTSTSVGDLVEVQSMATVLGEFQLPPGAVSLGSVKSNIGHLKGAAGAAGLLKTALALRDKVLPPSINCQRKNPNVDFDHCPLRVNTELRPWSAPTDGVRRAGVSAFGFGGTNFHIVLEEYIPHRLTGNGNGRRSVVEPNAPKTPRPDVETSPAKAPLRGALVIGADSPASIAERLRAIQKAAEQGHAPAPAAPAESDLRAAERIAIDYADAADLAEKSAKALKAFTTNQPATWKALRAQGIFRGQGPAPKVTFLYTGQGSQYANMLRPLRDAEPLVADAFAEADRIMTPLLGKPLSAYVFVDPKDPKAVAKAEDDLRQTEITQPAVLTIDLALTRLLGAYGIKPDFTMGHSLGEYGALVASGSLPFEDALHAVSARGRGMTNVSLDDNGRMAAVFAPLPEIERILQTIGGYVVIANINSGNQAVIGGASKAVLQAMEVFQKAGYNAIPLPVSHAFHTSIVAPASVTLRTTLGRLNLAPPQIPIVTNVTGKFYPTGPGVVPQMIDLLAQQVASPVQFVKGLDTLYAAGARVFVEVGPKKALQGFAEDVLGSRGDTVAFFTNHPKLGDVVAFNQALCGLYAAGLGRGDTAVSRETAMRPVTTVSLTSPVTDTPATPQPVAALSEDRYAALGRMLAEVLERNGQLLQPQGSTPTATPVMVSGAALGLPGTERIFDDANIGRILNGQQLIDVIPTRFRRAILDKHITRLVKSETNGAAFEAIDKPADVIKLAGRGGAFDLQGEFGIPADRIAALDRVTRLAMAAGIDALRDAGIPLVMRYKTTTKGTQLPDRWGLPEALRDETGVIFASCWPGFDAFADELQRYYTDVSRRDQLAVLENLRARADGNSALALEIDRRIGELRTKVEKEPYLFDRRFVFKTLSMGHSQFAEFIGARGPNTQVNAACASTTQAIAMAEDWIRTGRCRRVIVISADDITSDHLMEWMGAGFLASGAAATDEIVEEAALPFDRRRHGLILGMGAAALVVESESAVRERGLAPITEVLSAVTANSAYHGTRLDVQHIGQVMEQLVAEAERRSGVPRHHMAQRMVFVSHETYTPARGGSASAEVNALRQVFGKEADKIVIANTKGFTGHAMGTGIEDVVAVKALETGCVPPVANFKEVDPELGPLNLSKGGAYPLEYSLRLGAGFGSQISMTLSRATPANGAVRPSPDALGHAYRIVDRTTWSNWLTRMAGHPTADLEVVNRTLRVRDKGAPAPATVVIEVAVPPPPPKAAPEPVPEPPVTVPTDPVKDRVLALVSEKTGYPVEMLDLDLDLEADLGVDTVKQAEVFASVREAYNIPRDENLKLRDFPTLAHVIRFVHDRRPDLKAEVPQPFVAAAVPATNQAQETAVAEISDPIKQSVLNIVAEKTGYPVEMLDLDLDLEADLGVDTVKQAEVFAGVREAYNIPRDENLKLRDFPTLAHVIRFVHDRRPDLKAQVTQQSAPTPADDVKDRVLSLVAEKTGYPVEMLDLDLDLEADLGVDTVKQAEVFAGVREAYNIPRDENLKLRDFPTLAHVIRFVHDRRPDLKAEVRQTLVAAVGEAQETPVAEIGDAIQDTVLNIVVEKTGYPKEMLDLDLDLEADLGIDTVKQAEMFASVRAAFGIARDENLKLRDFPTLAHVIQFARDRASGPASTAATVTSAAEPVRPPLASLDAANRIPRRVPVPNLRPPLDLCKPTGVDLAGKRVVIMPDQSGVAKPLADQLSTRGAQVLWIEDASSTDAITNRLNEWMAAGPIAGVYWLPALDDEGPIANMDLVTWRESLRVRVKSLYTTMRTLYEHVAQPGTFLVSATRLGGQHGYDTTGATSPLGGAVVGFTKTYKRERTEALVKSVDFEPSRDASEVADMLIQETLRDPGIVEVGYKDGLRWTIGLQEQPAADGQPGMSLDKNTVFLITGAAGSIVSAITADLASASGGTFYLLDLVPEPAPDNPDLQRFATDRDGLKRDLFARIQERGERATPAMVEKELASLERMQAARIAIDAVHTAGGTAHYFSVNLTDAAAVAGVIATVRERHGRIDVLLHAAGMERSHFLPGKDPREFDLIFDVKADGWFNLLHAIGYMPLGATVAFSSIAGRFGNGGQTDYSSANDLLCKITSSFRSIRPATRGIAIDWTAWGGIGMATRGSIPKMMELAGIDMLRPEAGIPLIRRELTAGGTRGEIVVAERLGILLNEWDSTGGLDPAALDMADRGPMLGRVAGMTLHGGLTVAVTLDPANQPFLFDHRIDGTPVLPGVMGVEAFAEAAQSMLSGWCVAAVENVEFLTPFKFYRNEPRTLTIEAVLRPQDDALVAECRLTGSRQLPNQTQPQVTTHFTARVRLAKQRAETTRSDSPNAPNGSTVEASDIYRFYFHGPAYQVLERTWTDGHRIVGKMAPGLPENHRPSELPTLLAPRLIELCFQTAGVWEMGVQGRMGLPLHIDRVSVSETPEATADGMYAIVTPNRDGGAFDAEVVDAAGKRYVELVGYRTVALPNSVDAEPLKAMRAATA